MSPCPDAPARTRNASSASESRETRFNFGDLIMKKLIAILTACSLTFAVALQAAKPEGPEKEKKSADKPKAAPKQQQVAPKPEKEFKAPKQTERVERPAPAPDAAPKVKKQKPAASDAPAVQSEADTKVKNVELKKVKPDKAPKLEKTDKAPDATNVVADDKLRKDAKPTAKIKKLDPAAVQKIRQQHANFKATPNTAITSAQFNPNYRIEAAQNWSGPQYEVFRTYQPQWHDQTWYRSRYSNNLSLIGGGWYYWDAGYWYPAWGYDDAHDYYPYDGPIYVGDTARPFDQVVADVQAVLQEQGFYRGEVDGLVGPLTREALAEYQSAAGLYTTQTIDEPTLESLGLAG
jgi:outer membrane biosynthesis protein TonB